MKNKLKIITQHQTNKNFITMLRKKIKLKNKNQIEKKNTRQIGIEGLNWKEIKLLQKG